MQKSTIPESAALPPPETPDYPPLTCRTCGAIAPPTIRPGKGPHAFAAICPHCWHFISWVSKYTPAERARRREAGRQAAMARKPASALQLSYLHALGHGGPPPASMAEASQLIAVLRNKPATKGQQP